MSKVKEFKNCKDFLRILQLFFYTWKYGGFYPLFYISEGRIKYKKSWMRILSSLILFYSTLVVLLLYRRGKKEMDKMIVVSFVSVYIFNSCIPIINLHIASPKIKDYLNEMQIMIDKLETMSDSKLEERKTWYFLMKYLILQILLISSSLAVEVTMQEYSSNIPFSWLDMVIVLFTSFLDIQSQLFHLFIGLVLKKYYKHLNKASFSIFERYDLMELKSFYIILNSLCHNLNGTLTLVYFMRFGADFIVVMDALYVSFTANYFTSFVGYMRVLDGVISVVQKITTICAFLFVNASIRNEVR